MKNKSIKSMLSIALVLMLLINASTGALAFQADDVAGHWAGEIIYEWMEKGLAAGYPDGTFRPDNSITRTEFMALTNRAFGFAEEETIDYSDVSESDWFAGEVKRAKAAGYIGGYPDGTMKPDNPISRQEAAVIISKIKGLAVNPGYADGFSDFEDIADWSMGEVGAAAQAGYMGGYPDGSFRPLNPITRAEALAVLDRALNHDNWIIDKAGVYGPEEGTQSFDGNVEIRADGIALQNVIIDGDLTIAEEVGDGEVTLNNVTVEGDTYIRGGGPDSIYINGGDYKNIIIQKTGGKLRIVMVHDKGASVVVAEETEDTEIILEGTFDRIDVKTGGITLTVQGETAIKEIKIDKQAEDVAISTSKDTVIEKMTVNTSTYVMNEGRIVEAVGDGAKDSEYEVNLPENMQPTPSRRSGGSSSQQPPSDSIAVLIAEGWIPVATPEDLDAVRGVADEHTFGGDTGYSAESKGGLDKRYIQVADIDLDVAPWNEGEGWEPIGNSDSAFNGTYDGNGMDISNLFINSSSDNIGLFGYMEDAEVKNINLVNVDVKGSRSVGGLAGYNSKGIISDSQVEGTVTGQDYATGGLVGENRGVLQDIVLNSIIVEGTAQVGGLAGSNLPHYSEETESYDLETGFISNCHVEENVTVNAGSYTGGLAGDNNNGIIEKSSSRATVSGTYWVGGLVGSNNSTVRESFSSGSVSGTATSNGGTGGLIGYSWGEIENCYSTASVTGPFKVGGLVGRNATGITNSYSTGKVTGTGEASEIGGLVGECNSGSVENCYWDTQMSEQTASAAGTGYQTAQMIKSVNSVTIYTDWDFVYSWDIKPGESYPYFRWQGDENIPYADIPDLSDEAEILTFSFDEEAYEAIIDSNAGTIEIEVVHETDVTSLTAEFTTSANIRSIKVGEADQESVTTVNNFDSPVTYVVTAEDGTTKEWTVTVLISGSADFQGGLGTTERPYRVATAQQLDNVRGHMNMHFIQVEDIDLDEDPWNTGTGWTPLDNPSGFQGSYDGAGKTISNMMINTTYTNTGLFGDVRPGAIIKNVSIEGADITSTNKFTGILVGLSQGEVINCSVSGTVAGTEEVGGLIGHMTGLTASVTESQSDATVSGAFCVGGLVGITHNFSSISDSFATGNVNGTGSSGMIGGLVGQHEGGKIERCYASGTVSASGNDNVGGLIGRTSGGPITDSFSSSPVTGKQNVGGLIGEALLGTVVDCYASGDVTGTSNVGGLVGSHNGDDTKDSTINDSYAIGNVTGNGFVGGLVGYQGSYSSINNSYALNSALISEAVSPSTFNRILGYKWGGSLSGNYANKDMEGPEGLFTGKTFDGEGGRDHASWFIDGEGNIVIIAIAIDEQTGTLSEDQQGTITFQVTSNLPDEANLLVALVGEPAGLGITASPVSSGTATITVEATEGVQAGSYEFTVSYPDSDKHMQTISFEVEND